MWLNLLMDDCHFSNITKIMKIFVRNHIRENKKCKFSKNEHILHNGNNIVKNLMNAYLNSH
jgi:hypothetical protein